MLRVQEFGVDLSRSEEVTTDDEDLGRDITIKHQVSATRGQTGSITVPRRRRFRRLNFGEQLTEHPNQAVVVSTPEDLGDECAAFYQKLDCKFETHQHELGLAVSVLDPSGSNVWGAVMQHNICLPVLQFPSNEVSALRGCDIGSKGDDARDGLDRNQVNTFNCP